MRRRSSRCATGRTRRVPVTLTNTGRLTWDSGATPPILLSYHWLPADGDGFVAFEGDRTAFASPVAPGSTVTLDVRVRAPEQPGRYRLEWDLVQEGVLWFSTEAGAVRVDVECGRHRRCFRRRHGGCADAVAASDSPSGTPGLVAGRGEDVCRPSAPRRRARTTFVWSMAPMRVFPRRTREPTATTCISRCSPAAACSWAPRSCGWSGAPPAASRGSRAAGAAGLRAGARHRRGGARHRLACHGRFVPQLRADLRAVLADPRVRRRVRARRGGPCPCESPLTAPRCGRAARASATTPSTCCTISRRVACDDELIVVSNRADRHDVAAAVAGADRDAAAPRPADGLDADARRDRAAGSGGGRRALHQRHGAADVAGADRRDDPRHEPAALSALPSAAPRAAEPPAGRSRGAPRRRHHHGVRERQARHRPVVQPAIRAACTSSTRRRRRRSGACTIPPSSSGSVAATGWTSASSSTSARSSRGRTCRR